MDLTVRDVARMMNVAEKTVFRWIKDNHMPVMGVGDQYRFDRTQLLEWATARNLAISSDFFRGTPETALSGNGIADALTSGGIFHDLPASDKVSAIKAVVEAMRLPKSVDRDFLLTVLLAREDMASTGMGDGVAIPHVRNPIILRIHRPCIALGLLKQPIEFGALDGKPVFALFTMMCPTPREHLHLLSRLAFGLRDPEFKTAIEARASADEIIRIAARLDKTSAKPAS
jgi:PTS system nitrogen regulatory IIA component